MAYLPNSPVVLAAYNAPVARIRRRIEIYEKDGVTPFQIRPGLYDAAIDPRTGLPAPFKYRFEDSYLVDGDVSVDYTRDERRVLNLTLDNSKGIFSADPKGFFYDKVIKVFRGLDINHDPGPPPIYILEDAGGINASSLRRVLHRAGYKNFHTIKQGANSSADVKKGGIIVSMSSGVAPGRATLIRSLYAQGYRIFTLGSNIGTAYPEIAFSLSPISSNTLINVNRRGTGVSEIHGAPWANYTSTGYPAAGSLIATMPSGALAFAGHNSTLITGVVNSNTAGGRWAHLNVPWVDNSGAIDPSALFKAIFKWLDPSERIAFYEIQIGEFMVDSVGGPRFPSQVQITGRDYTKKLLKAKFIKTTQFAKTEHAETTIRTLAINGGIPAAKIIMPTARTALGNLLSFSIGTSRWEAIKKIAEAHNYEVFFNNVGQLVIRTFMDPSTSAPVYTIKDAGFDANMVDWTKTVSDEKIINQVVVSGESSNSAVLPVSWVAENNNPDSPTSIAKLGYRTEVYTSSAITTAAQAQNLANLMLRNGSIQGWDLSFGSICLDFLEAGDIIDVLTTPHGVPKDRPQPNPALIHDTSPTRYLLTNFTIPLALGPMSGVGKREMLI